MNRVTIMALHAALSAAANAQCWDWQPPYTSIGLVGTTPNVRCMTMWDADAAGSAQPLLAIIGRFSKVGDLICENVAFWDGSRWTSPGGGLPLVASTPAPSIDCCATIDFDGTGPMGTWLVVGGQFNTPWGDGPLMAWDGSAWHNLPGPRRGGRITQLLTVDPDGTSGPQPAQLFATSGSNIYEVVLSGVRELPLAAPDGFTAGTAFLAGWDPDGTGPLPRQLFAALNALLLGQPDRVSIQPWLGTSWGEALSTPLGAATDFDAADLDGAGPLPEQLLLAKNATNGGPVLRLVGNQWQRLGTRSEAAIDLCVVDPDEGGPAPASLYYRASAGLRQWLGNEWVDIGASTAIQSIAEMDFDGPGGSDPTLLVGGSMIRMPDTTGPLVNGLAKQAGPNWQPLHTGTDGLVNRIAAWDHDGDPLTPSRVVAAGSFTTMEGAAAGPIAVLADAGWTNVPFLATPATTSYTGPLGIFDPDGAGPQRPDLYISARFSAIGGVPLQNIARWDGAAFSPLASGISCTTGCSTSMQVFDPDGSGPLPAELIVAGTFNVISGPPSANIARWNGARWAALADGLNGPITSLALWDQDGSGPAPARLVAAGTYTGSGVFPLPGMAIWDGNSWMSLPDGSRTANPITVWDPDGDGPALPRLVAAQGNVVQWWNGDQWANFGPLGEFFHSGSAGSPGQVRAIASVDPDSDGPRPALLIAAGTFDRFGLWNLRNLAVWQYGEWRPLGSSAAGQITGLVPFDPDGPGPLPVQVLIESSDTLSPRSLTVVDLPPWVQDQPADALCSLGEEVEFSIELAGTDAATLQWRKDGRPIIDGIQPEGSQMSGVTTPLLHVRRVVRSDSGRYSCLVMNACGSILSQEAVLSVRCIADFDANGGIDGGDIEAFFVAWEAGDSRADVNDNGGVDGQDVERFFVLWESGSC